MAITWEEIRQKYPGKDPMDVAQRMHAKHYGDKPLDDFLSRIGGVPPGEAAAAVPDAPSPFAADLQQRLSTPPDAFQILNPNPRLQGGPGMELPRPGLQDAGPQLPAGLGIAASIGAGFAGGPGASMTTRAVLSGLGLVTGNTFGRSLTGKETSAQDVKREFLFGTATDLGAGAVMVPLRWLAKSGPALKAAGQWAGNNLWGVRTISAIRKEAQKAAADTAKAAGKRALGELAEEIGGAQVPAQNTWQLLEQLAENNWKNQAVDKLRRVAGGGLVKDLKTAFQTYGKAATVQVAKDVVGDVPLKYADGGALWVVFPDGRMVLAQVNKDWSKTYIPLLGKEFDGAWGAHSKALNEFMGVPATHAVGAKPAANGLYASKVGGAAVNEMDGLPFGVLNDLMSQTRSFRGFGKQGATADQLAISLRDAVEADIRAYSKQAGNLLDEALGNYRKAKAKPGLPSVPSGVFDAGQQALKGGTLTLDAVNRQMRANHE